MILKPLRITFIILFSISTFSSFAQFRPKEINWTDDGNAILTLKDGNIVRTDIKTQQETILVKRDQLIPAKAEAPLNFDIYSFSPDYKKLLIFTNRVKVWRYRTRGDYWVLNLTNKSIIHALVRHFPHNH